MKTIQILDTPLAYMQHNSKYSPLQELYNWEPTSDPNVRIAQGIIGQIRRDLLDRIEILMDIRLEMRQQHILNPLVG
jgi:hypothetical protein